MITACDVNIILKLYGVLL